LSVLQARRRRKFPGEWNHRDVVLRLHRAAPQPFWLLHPALHIRTAPTPRAIAHWRTPCTTTRQSPQTWMRTLWGKEAGDGKICFDNIKVFRYPSHTAFCREPPARGGASREKTPFLSPFGFESLVVRVGPVSMDSASGAYIIKEVTGDSQEYKINPTCEATFVVPEAI